MPVENQEAPRGRLSRPERQYRGRIAVAKRFGQDASALRRGFDELQATRQLREAAERLVAARVAQGFPERITDATTLARIATLIAAPAEYRGADAPPSKNASAPQPVTPRTSKGAADDGASSY